VGIDIGWDALVFMVLPVVGVFLAIPLAVLIHGRLRKRGVRGERATAVALLSLFAVWLLCATPWLVGPFIAARDAAKRTESRNNLYQIAVALERYQQDHGRFPPAVTLGAGGRKMHGWIVNLLPYLEAEDLYRRYDRSVPWDHPANRAVVETPLPEVGPDWLTEGKPVTHVRMVVCPGSICGVGRAGRLLDITDEPSQTLLLVEVADPVPWASPEAVVDPTRGIDQPGGLTLVYDSGFFAAFADNQTRFLLLKYVDHMTLLGLCTAAGGEEIDDTDY